MHGLLTKQNVRVETNFDRVILTVQKLVFPMPYAASFKIAAGLKLASQQAMRMSKEPLANWRNFTIPDDELIVNALNIASNYFMVRQFIWRIDVDGEMAYLHMADNRIGFHFETGFKIAQWLRVAGTQAKKWAGDSGTFMHMTGHLTDAENNYKLGLE